MAHTVLSPSAMRPSSSVPFMSISPSGIIETIMGLKNGNGHLSQAIQKKVAEARAHYEKLGAEKVFQHSLCVLRAAVEGKLLDPSADERDMLSMELTDQILYHSLTSSSHLPTTGDFSARFLPTHELERRLAALDSTMGDRSAAYVELLNDPSINVTNLLIALYTRVADMMTIHDPETLMAATTRMPGIFPVHSDWSAVQTAWADPMLRVYCPIADWGGQTHAYRQMRDNAVFYRYPERFQEVAEKVQGKVGALETTNKFILATLQHMARSLDLQVLVAPNYQVVSKLFDLVGPGTVAVALKPFKGVGGLLHKSLKKGIPLGEVHDWAGLTVITADTPEMYGVVSFLHERGVLPIAQDMGVSGLRIENVEDYATNPKPVTEYQSVHLDTMTTNGVMVPAEFIVRTVSMHKKADEGEASHDGYKGCPLVNGERKRFMDRKLEITASIGFA
ncbi:hypothetical protein KKB44_04125 [Candidatus Micrarchaeota archaeon]|nr:hypothetical protein [Candidatus Micrarchaeota archaeon]